MKISATEIRVGNVLKHNDKLWVVQKTQHTQPGKGGAFMQVEMKGLLSSTKINERFRSADTVEKVFLEDRPYTFLFSEDTSYTFMEPETFEQMVLDQEVVSAQQADFLMPDMSVEICFYEDKPISLKLPDTITLEVIEAEAVVKGQTASSSFKPAILENNVKVMVPQHIETGMKIIVNPHDVTYIERAKS